MNAPFRTADPAPPILLRLALLSGLGARAQGAADAGWSLPGGGPPVAGCRTCIDGGQDLMVTLRAGASGSGPLGIARATGRGAAGSARHWHRWTLDAGPRHGDSLIFAGNDPDDMPAARALLAGAAPDDPAYEHAVAELRARGRLYMATRDEPETGAAWLSFGIHPRLSPHEALVAIGRGGVWRQMTVLLGDLLGRPVNDRARPWSIAVSPGTGTVRVGSTNWARLPEGGDKAARLCRQIDALGGDGRRAEAAYALVAGNLRMRAPVGVAAEYDFHEGGGIAAFYTLRVPPAAAAIAPEFQGDA